MAIISKIQKHAYILVAIIAIALLTFLFEYINPNLSALRGGANYIGKVNGTSLEYESYKKLYDAKEKDLRASRNGQNPSEADLENIKNQIWGNFLVENVITKSMDNLGLGTSPAELVEMTTGQNIDPSLQQIPAFKNQNGQYDPILFKNFLKTLKQDDPSTPKGTRMNQWLEFENQMKNNRKMAKFNSLIDNGMYVPKWLNDYETKVFGTTADINYVVLPTSTVDIEKIKYESKELEEYFTKNKAKYTPESPTVKASSVAFMLTPSTTDSIEIMNKFSVKMEDMRNAKNDTAFFKAYGDKGYDLYYYKRDELATNPQAEQIFGTPAGGIIGPFLTKDNVNAVKVLSRRNISDSVFVQPLTISFRDVMQNQEGVNARLKLVDSIFRMLDTLNMDFNQIAAQYSADRGQTPPMWISRAENVWNPEVFFLGGSKRYFKSPSDKEGVVRILKVVNFPGNKPAVQIGQISTPYAPSTETQNAVYSKAMEFIGKCKTANDMIKLAKSYPGVLSSTVYLTQNNTTLEGLEGSAREAVRWAFNSKSGELSSMMQVGNNYVFLGNQGLRSKENLNFEDVKEEIANDFKKEKAFKLIADKLNGASLQEIATKNNTQIQSATAINFQNAVIGQLPEPSVVIAAISLPPNKVSKAIQGNNGVYKISSTKVYPSALKPEDALGMKTQINQMMKTTQGIIEAMLNTAKIDDNRVNMF